MTEQLAAWNYALEEGCFIDHHDPSFHPDSHLKTLNATAFSPQTELLADKRDRYCSSLPSLKADLEGDEDQPGSISSLKKLEKQCKVVDDEFSQLLPRWNDVYNNLVLSTELIEDLDNDLEITEYQKQRDPNLAQAWLPIFSLDDKKDEGLAFPPAAQKLELFLLHELEDETKLWSTADAKLAQIVSQVDMVNESLRNFLSEPLKHLHEDLFILPIQDVPPNVSRDKSSEPESVISTLDLLRTNRSANVQQIESSTSKDFRHENMNGMAAQLTHSCHGRASSSRSPELAQVLTLPLPSSDSRGEMQMVCDTPKRCEQVFFNDGSIVESASSGSDSMNKLPLPHNTSEGETTAHDAIPLSKTFIQCPAHFISEEDGDAESAKEMESTSTSEQSRQSDCVKENRDDKPPQLGLEREHFGSSHLLSQFMTIMGAAKHPTHPISCSETSVTASLSQSKKKRAESTSVSRTSQRLSPETEVRHKHILPAMTPKILNPSQTGSCLLSIQLGHSVIRHLEELWPVDHLIDRDFCSHIGMGNGTSFQASEVDVALTVEDGIIVTTLSQIRQRPLPGSKVPTTIRQRVYNLSQKYSRLTIFVLESTGPRDDTIELSPKDLDIYIDFVCFASSLEANISVHLVSGGNRTLSRWILSPMIRFAPQLIELDKTTTIGNTTWELFFRQTGMNVRAAHVLSHSLFEEFGASGLIAFLTMTTGDQIFHYGRKLGVERQVLQCLMVLGILNSEQMRNKHW
ncbi:hypothetical protein E4U21_001431 [Claviceps maximensis]|nr:hypothetical protein E4U21_001431 [Claviceps maximensis]